MCELSSRCSNRARSGCQQRSHPCRGIKSRLHYIWYEGRCNQGVSKINISIFFLTFPEGVPAGGEGAVDGRSLGFGDVVERGAVAMANHHLDGQQLVVSRTVTCQRRLITLWCLTVYVKGIARSDERNRLYENLESFTLLFLTLLSWFLAETIQS